MSNLLSELCGVIDRVACHVSYTKSIHYLTVAAAYKPEVKKLLIQYEAKDNPHMKINEIAAELSAFRSSITEDLNTLANLVIETKEATEELQNDIEHIAKTQDDHEDRLDSHSSMWDRKHSENIDSNFEYLQLQNKYKTAITVLRDILKYSRSGTVDTTSIGLKIIMAFNHLQEPIIE